VHGNLIGCSGDLYDLTSASPRDTRVFATPEDYSRALDKTKAIVSHELVGHELLRIGHRSYYLDITVGNPVPVHHDEIAVRVNSPSTMGVPLIVCMLFVFAIPSRTSEGRGT
jgi:hypothetical protein